MEREPQDKKLFCRWGEFAFVLGTFFIALGVSLMEKGGLGMSMVTSQSYIISLAVPFFTFGMADYLLQGVLLIGYYIIVRRFDWKNILSFFSAFIFGVVLDGKMLTGYTGAASELGHMVIRAGGEECTCGRRGCFEAYKLAGRGLIFPDLPAIAGV